MTWDDLDWSILERLRATFLAAHGATGSYWQGPADLAHYDFTYGERIGWKWDAVLGELTRRGWSPPARATMLDWGCGSGVAGRRVLAAWPALAASGRLRLADHSPPAVAYATRRAREAFPGLDAAPATNEQNAEVLVISHVLNELDAAGEANLATRLAAAEVVLWVEPGTSAVAGQLVAWRERLRATARVVLPCPHQGPCGMLQPENARHWCHHFARPPAGVFADSGWVKFGQRAGIDLRSLPYACLVLDRRPDPAPLPAHAARIIGRPESFKPYTRLLSCSTAGIEPLTVPKRRAPALHKALQKPDHARLCQWTREGNEILDAVPLGES
jgi:SAM-dependent methyltransferase